MSVCESTPGVMDLSRPDLSRPDLSRSIGVAADERQ